MASPNQSRRSRVIEGMAIWGSYYRENIDIFVEEYLQLDFLKWFQTALLVMMDRSRTFLWIAARGMGKSLLSRSALSQRAPSIGGKKSKTIPVSMSICV